MTHTPYIRHAQPYKDLCDFSQKKAITTSQSAEFAMARAALFVIDIQVELAQNATTEIPHAERILDAGTRILQRARQAIDSATEQGRVPGLEIVFVQHEEVAEKGPLIKGSKPWELVFKPQDNGRWERLVSKDIRE